MVTDYLRNVMMGFRKPSLHMPFGDELYTSQHYLKGEYKKPNYIILVSGPKPITRWYKLMQDYLCRFSNTWRWFPRNIFLTRQFNKEVIYI